MSLISIGANCGKHTYSSPRDCCAIFAVPGRASARSTNRRVFGRSSFVPRHACYRAYTRVVSSHMHLNFYGTFTFPRRFLFPPISPPRCSENNARDPTPINWFLRDICNFLAARLSPWSFIAHFICARPPLSRRNAEARNHGWSYVTFTLKLAKLIRPFFKHANNAVSVWYRLYVLEDNYQYVKKIHIICNNRETYFKRTL